MEVSILMGVYNGADTLRVAVESIFAQTYQDFEFIVCDDGSTDDSYTVLEKCQNIFGRRLILLHNDKNQGLASSLNRCLAVAKGTYIGRMDADDRSASERLSKQLSFLKEHPDIGFVGCCAYKFDENGVYGTFKYPAFPTLRNLRWNACFIHPTMLLHRNVLDAVGGYDENPFCVRCEDYDLWLRLYAMGYQGANLQEKLFYYYEGQQNLCKRKYRYRINESFVRARGFWLNHILLSGLPYVIKPLVVGLLPARLLCGVKSAGEGKEEERE